jgi:hypothetical protein
VFEARDDERDFTRRFFLSAGRVLPTVPKMSSSHTARAAGRRASMERGVSSAEGVGAVDGGSAVADEMDEMQFSGTSRSTRRTRRLN